MSTSSSSFAELVNTLPTSRWPAWTREPLFHFVVLGMLLFLADHFISARENDPRVIVVAADVDAPASRLFNESRNREPND